MIKIDLVWYDSLGTKFTVKQDNELRENQSLSDGVKY